MYKRKRNIAVFTDTWDFGVYDAKVPENGLLPGELSAVTFRVGCYIVRSALRAYRCHKVGDILEKQGQVPARPSWPLSGTTFISKNLLNR